MKRLLASTALFLCSLLTFAQFSGSGSGTENDPYLILNPIQLNQMRNFLNQYKVYFKLMADIDLTEFIEDEYPSEGWTPIGTSSTPFSGVLDGNGKTISGLWMDRPNKDYVGLFAYINVAEIKNLTLTNSSIKGNRNVGMLVGYGKDSQIMNCIVEGELLGNANVGGCIGSANAMVLYQIASYTTVKANDCVGGVIGNLVIEYYENSSISDCSFYGDIDGGNSIGGIGGNTEHISNTQGKVDLSNCHVKANIIGSDYVGGVCGKWGGSFSCCSFIGDIKANSYVGGVCGFATMGGVKMEKCFAISNISANANYVGGLSGCSLMTIKTSYFSGTVVGFDMVGGLVGYKHHLGIDHSYFNGVVKGNKYVGGICGMMNNDTSEAILVSNVVIATTISATEGLVGRIYGACKGGCVSGEMGTQEENKAWNRTIVIDKGVVQDIMDNEQNGAGSGSSTLKYKATYIAMGWDFTDTWEIQETECYPYFKTQTAPPVITSDVISGATTISGKCKSGATVTLEIDGVKKQEECAGTTFLFTVDPLQAGHEVRVSAKVDGKEQSFFTTEVVAFLGKGTEDDPYQISTAADLTQVYRYGYYKLMNDIDLTSYINKFSSTEGWESIGRGGSETIYFDGDGHKVTGLWCNSTRDNTGLFSCFANGYIKNLIVETASGKQVKGGNNTGILVGKMINGAIENCRVSGNVADGTPVGGIVGLLEGGGISLCQASVIINTTGDDTYVGGLVGEITSGEIDQCVTMGTLTATGKNPQAGGLVGKNTATITNCYSNVAVTSAYCAAGLVAYNYGLVEKCYATGNLSSQNYGAGVIGYNDGENAVIRNCGAMNQIIDVKYESQSAQSGGYGQRILGGYKNGAPDPEMNNYALKAMQLSVNDLPQKVYNDIMNGTAKKGSELMTVATYQAIGWDFTNTWSIMEGDSYPYLKNNVAEAKKYEKMPPRVIVPSAIDGLVYNGQEQNLVLKGSTTIGDVYYSLDGTTYSKGIPTGIDAKAYTVYYKVVDDEDNSESNLGSVNTSIDAKLLNNATVTLGETSYVYDGKAKEPTVTVMDGETEIPSTDYVVSYSNNAKVGEASVTISSQSGKNYKFPTNGIIVNFDILREIANLFNGTDMWAGYVAAEDLALPTDLTAYTITALGYTSATATFMDYIPKGLPVLLKRNDIANGTFLLSAGTGSEPSANLLKVYDTDKTVSNREGYVLYKDEFVLVNAGTLPAGRIFLPLNGGNAATTRGIVIEDDGTTGIWDRVSDAELSCGAWYDLQGRKLDVKPTKKGVYILNGHKVVVK